MNVLTLILAGGQGSRLSILGEKRAKPAVPFAGKYRIIDFPLSSTLMGLLLCNQGEVISISWAFSTQDLVSAKLNRTNPDGSVTALYGGDDVTTPGSYDDLAAEPGDYTYTITVSTEFGGTQTATVNVTVQ